MLLDNETLFCDNQEIKSGTTYSENTVRFGKGDISYVPVIVQITKEFQGLEKLNVKFQTSDNSDFSNPVDLVEATLNLEDLKEGNKFPFNYLPKGNLGYIRLCFNVEGTATQGAITAGAVYAQDSER